MAERVVKKWDEYRRESKFGEFVIEDSEGKEIVVHEPDSEQIVQMSKLAQNDIEGILRALCGDTFEPLWELIRHQPVDVMNSVISDIMKHFGYDVDVPGGSRVSST